MAATLFRPLFATLVLLSLVCKLYPLSFRSPGVFPSFRLLEHG